MSNREPRLGHLVVVEGPENTGKTTLAQRLAAALIARGAVAEYMSFPGRGTASLGAVVYGLEHEPAKYGMTSVPPAARQVLHLAAHIDAIENRIKPALRAGHWVVLDRYWWSMFAHGSAQRVAPSLLNHLIEAEREIWQPVVPVLILLTLRPAPFAEALTSDWQAVATAYASLWEREKKLALVELMAPEASVENRVTTAIARLSTLGLLG